MKPVIISYKGKYPKIADDAFIAPGAIIIGDVEIGSKSSVWFGCVLRGDVNHIKIGERTNIQDGTVIHVSRDNLNSKIQSGGAPTIIGNNITIGHSAMLHGCILEDESFIGIHSTILDHVIVKKHGMVAAGGMVPSRKTIPGKEIWAGNPAKLLRKMTEEEFNFINISADNYVSLAEDYYNS